MRAVRPDILARYDVPARPFPDRRRSTPSTTAGNVVVAAPTGSGKTVVAEYAIGAGPTTRRASVLHRADQGALEPEVPRPRRRSTVIRTVGLLTGDNSINGDAPVVVMTTEVLRNMIYDGQQRLDGSRSWSSTRCTSCRTRTAGRCGKRLIFHRPSRCDSCACRRPSATRESSPSGSRPWRAPDRGGDRGASSGAARQPLSRQRPHQRPSPYAADDRGARASQPRRVTPRRHRAVRFRVVGRDERSACGGAASRKLTPRAGSRPSKRSTDDGMLPSIYFIFSRTQCDEAARACVDAGLRSRRGRPPAGSARSSTPGSTRSTRPI